MNQRCVREILGDARDHIEVVLTNLNCGITPTNLAHAQADVDQAILLLTEARGRLAQKSEALRMAGAGR